MNTSRSSRAATWLLERLLPGPNPEGIIGDIVEQSARRSGVWLWWQTLTAIVMGTAREVRGHVLLLSLAAFFVGYGAAALLGIVNLLPGPHVLDQMLAGTGAGWAVGRIGRLPLVVTFAVLVLAMNVPSIHAVVMGFLDHFGGAWLLAHHGLGALPGSLGLAQTSIMLGGLWATCRKPIPSQTARS